MRTTALLLLVLTLSTSFAQKGFKLGVEASPAWYINIQRQASTSLISNTNGYGFNLGVPVRWGFSETMALQTGLNFEMMLFDVRFNKQLQSSNRHGSIHIPLQLSYALSGGWNLLMGTGLNYMILNKQWYLGLTSDISIATNKAQPYAALGISTMMERGSGIFELGVIGRFHFIDLYNGDTTFSDPDFRNWIFSIDLSLRYYLLNR